MSNEVPIIQIGDLIQTKNDKSKQLQSGEYLRTGILPIIDQGSKPICGYTNDLSKSYDKGLPVVVFGDHTLHTKYVDFKFAIGADGTQLLAPKDYACDTKYLYYLISRAAELIGSEGYKRHFKILKEFNIEYIEALPEQQKIATILLSVDSVIEKTRAQIDKLKDLKTGMMQELLIKGIGSGGVLHTEFKDSPVGRIPAEWTIANLDEVTKVVDSLHQTPKFSSEGFPMIRVSDIKPGKVNTARAFKVSKKVFDQFTKNYKPNKGDLLMSRVGSYGICCYLDREIDVCLGQNTVVITPDGIDYLFLYYSMYSEAVQNQIELEVAGSGYKSLSLASIRSLSIPLPSKEEQKRIASTLVSIDDHIEASEKKLKSVSNAKKALMQDLLTGKVRVKTEEKEKEPAVA